MKRDFVIVKAGFMTYRRDELGLEGDAEEWVRVYYPKELLSKDETVASFRLLPLTMEHEGGFVGKDKESPYLRGIVEKVWYNALTEAVEARALITEPSLARALERSVPFEISGGWRLEIAPYGEDFIATKMEADHVSLVKRGRCGSFCRVKEGDPKEKYARKGELSRKVEESRMKSHQVEFSSDPPSHPFEGGFVESESEKEIAAKKSAVREREMENRERLRKIARSRSAAEEREKRVEEAFLAFYQSKN